MLGFVIEFRSFVKKYLPRSDRKQGNDSDDYDDEVEDAGKILQVTTPDFILNFQSCKREFDLLKFAYDQTISKLIEALQVSRTKSGDINQLSSMYMRLNFNHFYNWM